MYEVQIKLMLGTEMIFILLHVSVDLKRLGFLFCYDTVYKQLILNL